MAYATIGTNGIHLVTGRQPDCIRGIAGLAITHGFMLIWDSTANTVKLADANALATTSVVAGMAVSHMPNLTGNKAVASGESLDIALPNAIVEGFTDLVTGKPYFVSATCSGRICTRGDLASGDFLCKIGNAMSNSRLQLTAPSYEETAVTP